MRVVVIGASDKPKRYSCRALNLLLEKGHEVCPVNPGLSEIKGIKVYHELKKLNNGKNCGYAFGQRITKYKGFGPCIPIKKSSTSHLSYP